MIREIRPSDKERVLEICSQIWEGGDYIPHVFDEWVRDDGLFAGLWENDVLVGFGKLSWHTPTDVWLEGLRKDAGSGVHQVGEKLSRFYFEYLKGKKVNSIRFSTYFGNSVSLKLNEKMGFRKILELSLKSKTLETPAQKIDKHLSNEIDFTSFRDLIENSEYLKSTKFNIFQGWVVHHYSAQLLRKFYDQKKFVLWQQNGKIEGFAVWNEVHYQDVFWISLLEAATKEIFADFLNYFYSLNQGSDKGEIQMLVPHGQLLEFCRETGFTSWEQENDFFLYELPASEIRKITG